METNFYSYFLGLYICILFFHFIGHLVCVPLGLRQENPHFSFLSKQILGLITTITVFSLFQTSFISLNLFWLLLFGILLYWNNENKTYWKTELLHIKNEFSITNVALLLFLPTLFFLLRFISVVEVPSMLVSPQWQHQDHVIYMRIADYITTYQKENAFGILQIFNNSNNNLIITPYHYFDIWSFACIKFLNDQWLTSFIYEFIAFPYHNFLFIYGMITLFSLQAEKKKQHYVFMLLMGIGLGIAMMMYSNFFLLDFVQKNEEIRSFFNTFLFFEPFFLFKINFIEIIIIYVLCLLYKQQIEKGLLFLLALPIANIILAPTVLSGIVLCLIYLLFIQKNMINLHKTKSIVIISMCFIFVFYVFIMFRLFKPNENEVVVLTHFGIEDIITNLLHLPHTLYRAFVKYFLNSILLLFPFVILGIIGLSIYHKKIEKQEYIGIGILLSGLFCSFLFYALIHNITDSFQVIKIPIIVFIKTCIIIGIMTVLAHSKYIRIIFCILIFIVAGFALKKHVSREFGMTNVKNSLFNTTLVSSPKLPYAQDYYKKVAKTSLEIVPSNEPLKAISLLAKEDFPQTYKLNYALDIAFGSYINYARNNFWTVIVSWYEIEGVYQDDNINALIKNSNFMLFAEQQKKEGKFVSYDQTLLYFIKHHKIRCAIASPNFKKLEMLQPYIEKVIEDSKTKEKFIVFKKL